MCTRVSLLAGRPESAGRRRHSEEAGFEKKRHNGTRSPSTPLHTASMTNNTTNKVAPEERWKAAISSALAQHKAPAPENNDTSAVLVRKDSRYWDGRDQVVTVQRKKTEQQISGEEEKKKQKQRRRHRRSV